MKRLIGILLVLFSTSAYAGSVTLNWTPPTENEDGTLITEGCAAEPSKCLDGYRLYHSQTQGGPYTLAADVTEPSVVTYVVENLSDGTHYFVATAYNVGGEESQYSNEAQKEVITIPAPPTNLTVVEPESVAYAIAKINDDLMLLAVGTVPGGAPCKDSSVNGKHVVDRQYVNWSSSNTAFSVVVADCG